MELKDALNFAILLATIFAIVWGPIKAVQISRQNDDEKEVRRRKFAVFHDLMKTRRLALASDHVMALNLIQVEFYQHQKINDAYRRYMALLSRPAPAANDAAADQFYEEQEDGLYDLLHEIGDELGYKYDKRDLRKLAYGPKGWQNDEAQLRAVRMLLIEVMSGRRPIPVTEFKAPVSVFPPPP